MQKKIKNGEITNSKIAPKRFAIHQDTRNMADTTQCISFTNDAAPRVHQRVPGQKQSSASTRKKSFPASHRSLQRIRRRYRAVKRACCNCCYRREHRPCGDVLRTKSQEAHPRRSTRPRHQRHECLAYSASASQVEAVSPNTREQTDGEKHGRSLRLLELVSRSR